MEKIGHFKFTIGDTDTAIGLVALEIDIKPMLGTIVILFLIWFILNTIRSIKL